MLGIFKFDLSKVQTRFDLIFKTTFIFENPRILLTTYHIRINKKNHHDKINIPIHRSAKNLKWKSYKIQTDFFVLKFIN